MKKLCIVAVAAFLTTATGWSITVSNVDGNWLNPVGGASVNYVNGVAVAYGNHLQDQIKWGISTGHGQSGLGFTGIVGPSTAPLVFGLGDAFEVGQLQHFNQPITGGSAVSSADLAVQLTFTDPASLIGTFQFTFSVNETPNPAPDIISFPNSYANEIIYIGGTKYTLQLLGFGDSPSTIVSQLVSPEGGTASTKLWGKLTSEFPSVPDGGMTLVLLGSALVALGTVRRLVRF